jgi:hypothetical protein
MITFKISMKKAKASKQMCHYICSPRFLGLALKTTRMWEWGKSVLPTIVANTRLKFLWLEDLWLRLAVLKISQRLMLGWSHSPMA